MSGRRVAFIGALAVVGIVAGVLALAGSSADAASTPTTNTSGDRLTILGVDGRVAGTITKNAPFTVDLLHDGVLKASTSGRSDDLGTWNSSIGYDSGRTWGIHNGDVVRLRDGATGVTTELQRKLDAAFDEASGMLVGKTTPKATIAYDLYTNGDRAKKVGSSSTTADSTGAFRVDFGRVFRIQPATWRGYQAELVMRPPSSTGRSAWQTVQTWNTTLTWTRAQAGGGYFLSGTAVRFELVRNGTAIETLNTTADADGIPRGIFTNAIAPGDVMRTTWKWTDGSARSQQLEPFDLTATVDQATGTISGHTAPDAQVATWYYGDGDAPVRVSARAGADGRWSATLPSPVGDRLLVVWRVADPGRTGVGCQQVELRTPALKFDARTGDVTGYGPPGPATTTVSLVRDGAVVAQANVMSTLEGGFTAKLGVEAVPGDELRATGGGATLVPLRIGADVTGTLRPDGTFGGAGTPGRTISVSTTATTVATTSVGTDGTWSVPLPMDARGWLLLREVVPTGEGPSAGSSVYHWEHTTAPEVRIVSPSASATVAPGSSVTVDAYDADDGAPPRTVWFHLKGPSVDQWVEDAAGPYVLTLPTSPGSYMVVAYAYDALGRTDSGKAIYDQTAPRTITVR